MKKIISAILSLSLSVSCVTLARAESRTIDINTALTAEEIHILYNDAVVPYTDVKPVNHEDRVMIPFRAALESMGANVDYDDATRTVTASKGDITIKFALLDDTIYINNNGAESTITMDVPMIIVNDRTLVPIRFMSNALGMQVGWDGETQTVVIMDYDDYFEEFSKIAPNITKVSDMSKSGINKSSSTFDFSVDTKGRAEDISIAASGSAETVKTDDASGINAMLSLKSNQLSFENAGIDAVLSGTTLYIRASAISEIAKASDSVALKALALVTDADSYYSIDISRLLTGLGADGNTVRILTTALGSAGVPDIDELIMSNVTTEGDAVFSEAMSLASTFDIYEALDKHITVSQKENGGYTVSVNITPEQFVQIINASLGSYMNDESKAALLSVFNCSVNASVDNDVTSQKTDAEVKLTTAGASGTLDLSFKLSGAAETDESAAGVSVPAESQDITDIFIGALK